MGDTNYNLQRFLDAQEDMYLVALKEIRKGGKQSHWIWYIFPQEKGLGYSYNSQFYGLDGEEEARAYLAHPVLGTRLREITRALLAHRGQRTIRQLMGLEVDVLKLHSSMQLFDKVSPDDVFAEVLKAYFSTKKEEAMKDIRITVMRKACYRDLMALYENPLEHPCDMEEGQVFIAHGWEKPEGLCESAWQSMSPFVMALAHGGSNFYDGWMKNERSAMISCNDGFRPVSFLIEVID